MHKRIQWVATAVLAFFSPALLALGLGGAVVESYLDQPLDVRVELISQSSGEIQSITAGLASVDDFELLGLSRSAITVPLMFEVVTDADQPYVHITSNLNINEPVLQVLVEVVWANGRMLREYTLFLDPPTFDSPAPPVVIKPAPAPAPVAAEPPPIQRTVAPAVVVEDTAQSEVQEIAEDTAASEEPAKPEPVEEPAVTPEAAEEDTEQVTEQEPEQKPEPEPEQKPVTNQEEEPRNRVGTCY